MERKAQFAARALGGVLAAVVLLASAAPAAVLLEERFDAFTEGSVPGAIVATEHGRGWRAAVPDSHPTGVYLRYPAAEVLRPEAGTIEFGLVRDGSQAGESLFGLRDREGAEVLHSFLSWEGDTQDQYPEIEFGTRLWYTRTKTYRGRPLAEEQDFPAVVLEAKVAPGERVHFVFTWGPAEGDNAVYVNGRRLPARADTPFGMAELVRGSAWFIFGAEPKSPPFAGAAGHLQSLLEYLRVYDEPLDGAALFAADRRAAQAAAAPVVASVSHDASRAAGFSGKLVAGDALTVMLQGTPGTTGTFEVAHFPGLDRRIALDWRGWGVYLEEKVFYEPGEVNLREVEGYRVYAATEPFDVAAPPLEPVERLQVDVQSYTLDNLEIDSPYYLAVLAEMRDGTLRPVIAPIVNQPLTEGAPGVYTGSYRIGHQDRYARAVVVGRLAGGGTAAALAGDASASFAVDPSLTLAVATEPSVLRADEKSTAKVSVTVTDANGAAVAGHKVKFLLATTSQYTGVVGGGAFAYQVGGEIRESLWGETDIFGRVTATYVAGFAAKTAIIVAREMTTNSTGAGYITTFIQSAAQLELTPPAEVRAMLAGGYQIAVTSSDEWLTADGRSRARITARVTLNDQPVEGHKVSFEVPAGTGQVTAVREMTGRDGEARAVYTAGRKIGVVYVTATDTTVGISGSVRIELRSDAPAKIAITLDPQQLPADGRSSAELRVSVTDANDNPNENVEVEYAIAEGGGRLSHDRGRTDLRGASRITYTAGRTPGRVQIEITVRSPVPADAELAKARGLALAVTDHRFF